MKEVTKLLMKGTKLLDNGESVPSREWMEFVMGVNSQETPTTQLKAQLPKHNINAMIDNQTQTKRNAIPKELYEGWDALDKGNKLAKIKANDATLYCVLYNERFGKYPDNEFRQNKYHEKKT